MDSKTYLFFSEDEVHSAVSKFNLPVASSYTIDCTCSSILLGVSALAETANLTPEIEIYLTK